MRLMIAGAMLALGLPQAAGAADAAASGAVLARNCITCHGDRLQGFPPIPPLANLGADQLRGAMTDFKAGRREGTIMERIAKGYSDAEIDLLARALADPKRVAP